MSEKAINGERLIVPDCVTAPNEFMVLGNLSVSSQELRDELRLLMPGSIEHTTTLIKASLRERLVTNPDRTFRTDDILTEFFGRPGLDRDAIERDIVALKAFCQKIDGAII